MNTADIIHAAAKAAGDAATSATSDLEERLGALEQLVLRQAKAIEKLLENTSGMTTTRLSPSDLVGESELAKACQLAAKKAERVIARNMAADAEEAFWHKFSDDVTTRPSR